MSTPGLDQCTVDRLRRDLLAGAGHVQTGRQVIQAWELSAVERLFLADGSTIVYKAAVAPFTGEAAVLRALGEQHADVPVLHGYAIRRGTLGMLMDDLGDPLRPPTAAEAAATAAQVHALPPLSMLPTFDQAALARLPEQALDALAALRQQARFLNTNLVEELLQKLAKVARRRADGAERPPFGLCHGEFHLTSLHVSRTGCHLVDWAKAFTGPGLLDLATWFGTRTPAKPASLARLIHNYISVGGQPDAATDRGGLPAAQWALGWHRVWAAWWYLTTAATGHHRPDTDERHHQIVLRQLLGATQLLAALPATTSWRSMEAGRPS
ncbi:aminoglycoside phosphotransferase [Micromonospora sp. NPDC047738]|uniref:aminoglycoside phosphotransferase n=1 Tax=Micromonospora sp. NPDC047738 TaxID=3155741 RepID=UPI0033DC5CE0